MFCIHKKLVRRFLCALLATIVPVLATNLVGYGLLGATSPPNGFSVQVFGSGVAAVVAKNGNITPQQQQRIDAYLDTDYIREWYQPWGLYRLIWHQENPLPAEDPDLNSQIVVALGNNKAETIKLYLELLPANLRIMAANLAFGTYEIWGIEVPHSHVILLLLLAAATPGCWNLATFKKRWPLFLPVAGNILSIAVSTITNEPRYLLPTWLLFAPLMLYLLWVPALPADDATGAEAS